MMKYEEHEIFNVLNRFLLDNCYYNDPVKIENINYNSGSNLYYAIVNNKELVTIWMSGLRILSLCIREYDPKFLDEYKSCVLQAVSLSNLDGPASYQVDLCDDNIIDRYYYIYNKYYSPNEYLEKINEIGRSISDKLAKELLFNL